MSRGERLRANLNWRMNMPRFCIALLTVAALCSPLALAGEKESKDPNHECTEKPQDVKAANLPKCPVTGEPVNLFVSVATDEGPVFFCCPKCIDKYKGHEKDFAEKVTAQRDGLKKLTKVQTNCPVSGEPVSEKSFSEKGDHKVFFCCDKCKAKYEAEPAKYSAKLTSCYTYQAVCPVMGEEIDPTCFKDFGTQRVYFCCPMCIKKLTADPEKYAANMAKQGYKLDVDAVKKAAAAKDDKKADGKKDEGKPEKKDKP